MHGTKATYLRATEITGTQGKPARSKKSRRMIFFPLLFILISFLIVALAYYKPDVFFVNCGDSGSNDDNQENGLNNNEQQIAVWVSDALGNDKENFDTNDSMYASVQAAGQTVTFYVTMHRETWNTGDTLADVSGGTELVTLNQNGVQTVEVWVPLLDAGSYDVVVDANNNGVFDLGVDGTDVARVTLFAAHVVPEVPFGTVVALIGMMAAVVGFAGFNRFRPKYSH